MEGKTKEDQPANAGKHLLGLGQGCHPPTHGLSPGEQRQSSCVATCLLDRSPHAFKQLRATVGRASALLRIGELVTECRNPVTRKCVGDRRHRVVMHVRAGTVGKDAKGVGIGRPLQQARNPPQLR